MGLQISYFQVCTCSSLKIENPVFLAMVDEIGYLRWPGDWSGSLLKWPLRSDQHRNTPGRLTLTCKGGSSFLPIVSRILDGKLSCWKNFILIHPSLEEIEQAVSAAEEAILSPVLDLSCPVILGHCQQVSSPVSPLLNSTIDIMHYAVFHKGSPLIYSQSICF